MSFYCSKSLYYISDEESNNLVLNWVFEKVSFDIACVSVPVLLRQLTEDERICTSNCNTHHLVNLL